VIATKTLQVRSSLSTRFGWALPRPRTMLALAAALLAMVVVVRQGRELDWQSVWARLGDTNQAVLIVALLVFYLALPLRTARWRLLLRSAGVADDIRRLPSPGDLLGIVFRSWFVNCVTIARLGDVYRVALLQRAVGADRATTLGTIVAERLVDLATLAATLAVAALLTFRGQLPREIGVSSAMGLVVALGGGVVVASAGRARAHLERLLPTRFHDALRLTTHGFTRSFTNSLPAVAILSVAAWLAEGIAFFLVAAAVGVPLPLTGAIVAALIGSLLTAIPLTPSGLGFTEVGIVVVLTRLGVDPGSAGAITLLYRLVTYWSLVALGATFAIVRRGV
jgi:uncharacterized protein (TIRG00374 family)